jgi:GNAT superfamily N-acetyltransferase
MVSLTICPLADAPEAIPLLAMWVHEEWSDFDARSEESIQAQLAENLNRDHIPITFVAVQQAIVCGTVSLDLADLPSYDHLSPWLASLYVVPAARGKGIGNALVRQVQKFAKSHGFGTLHLWTPGSTRLYESCGWTLSQRTTYRSRTISLMRFDPA